ncbi:uncharacterized protein BEWA_042120 [Theileria equi strain WA]|uniref:Membrane protein, putative n=1 Tax=Theileria equi strain WA TaxID=1537102 RepID=L1LFX6_THEEQ|nr:uncharacterized protein BEWA_042120 [Theileria equi strain WA]EKX74174.1 membrane protein, putative [Theileria equi strain WA]|eukprot:XP_004833626.1 uncharacterized protein BEWA_042120 [Theileria equi strain WA]
MEFEVSREKFQRDVVLKDRLRRGALILLSISIISSCIVIYEIYRGRGLKERATVSSLFCTFGTFILAFSVLHIIHNAKEYKFGVRRIVFDYLLASMLLYTICLYIH